jgi:hypothetical protein
VQNINHSNADGSHNSSSGPIQDAEEDVTAGSSNSDR